MVQKRRLSGSTSSREQFSDRFNNPEYQRWILLGSTCGIFALGLILWTQPFSIFAYFPLNGAQRNHLFYSQLGLSLCTAGILTLTYELLLRKGMERYISARLYGLISTMNSTSAQAELAGISGIVTRRDPKFYESLVIEARTEFLCSGISLPDICHPTMLDIILERLQECPTLRVQILLLSPFSLAAQLKGKYGAYRGAPTQLSNQIMSSALALRSLATRLGDQSDRLNVRFYWNPPTLSIVMNEKRADVAAYDEVSAANLSPSMQLERADEGRPAALYSRYRQHFDLIWSSSRAVDILSSDVVNRLTTQMQIDGELVGLARKLLERYAESFSEGNEAQ